MPKGALEITGENLEDLLAYDDLFLDYFNCFLALPVFPQALVYNRLTGAFDEVEGLRPELLGSLPNISPSIHYGPTDVEREKMLEWAREERLPLFLRTQLFRELKLVKLLLRPLEIERQSASRGSSRNIRGYSRATESYISSLSVSGNHSGHDIYDYDDIWGELHYSALYRYQRPGSRALSLPTRILFDSQSYGLPSTMGSATTRSSEQSSLKALSAITSRRFGAASTVQFSEFPEKPPELDQVEPSKAVLPSSGKTTETARQKARISTKVEVIPTNKSVTSKSVGTGYKSKSSQRSKGGPQSSTEEAFLRGARVLSAPVNYEQYLKMPRLDIHDFEALFGESEPELIGHPFVQFDEEAVSEEQTETDMRNMEGRLKMTVQQVKEKVLGSHTCFEEFREFLHGTSGEHLLSFWLECENFKDTMEDFDDIENMEIRNAHFRDIQDKFKLKLTSDALEQITRAASNMGLSHTIFLRTQYDVLRRLRAYWVPRFLIHCEITRRINLDNDEDDDVENLAPLTAALPLPPTQSLPSNETIVKPQGKTQMPFFPCISLVHSMPVLPEDARDYANKLLMNVAYDNSNDSQRRMFPRQRSTLSARSKMSVASNRRSTKERFVMALAADRLAGGPFERYLARLDDPQLLASLLFWEDVTEYGSTEDHSSDRLLRLCHAWNIYNKYLSDDSPHRIELPEKERNRLQDKLEKARDFMEASIFDHAKVLAVEKLERAWIRYLKEDLKTFLDCRVKPGGESPPSTAEAIEITVTEYDVVIKRPRPWVRRVPGSTNSERARRLNRALMMAEDIDDERRAQRKAEAQARRKEMEKERKKAIRAAYARQREAKKKQPSTGSAKDKLDEELPEGDEGETGVEKTDRVPTYQDMSGNRQIMSMFRKFVSEGENKDAYNLMQLYNDVETYFALKDNKIKKDAQASHISKTYLDTQGKKHTPLNNEKLISRIGQEKERPKSGVLREIQRTVLPRMEEVFKEFISKQAEEFNMDPSDLATMSQSELAMRMGNDQAMMSGWNKRKSRGKHDLPHSGEKEIHLSPFFNVQVTEEAERSDRPPVEQNLAGSKAGASQSTRRGGKKKESAGFLSKHTLISHDRSQNMGGRSQSSPKNAQQDLMQDRVISVQDRGSLKLDNVRPLQKRTSVRNNERTMSDNVEQDKPASVHGKGRKISNNVQPDKTAFIRDKGKLSNSLQPSLDRTTPVREKRKTPDNAQQSKTTSVHKKGRVTSNSVQQGKTTSVQDKRKFASNKLQNKTVSIQGKGKTTAGNVQQETPKPVQEKVWIKIRLETLHQDFATPDQENTKISLDNAQQNRTTPGQDKRNVISDNVQQDRTTSVQEKRKTKSDNLQRDRTSLIQKKKKMTSDTVQNGTMSVQVKQKTTSEDTRDKTISVQGKRKITSDDVLNRTASVQEKRKMTWDSIQQDRTTSAQEKRNTTLETIREDTTMSIPETGNTVSYTLQENQTTSVQEKRKVAWDDVQQGKTVLVQENGDVASDVVQSNPITSVQENKNQNSDNVQDITDGVAEKGKVEQDRTTMVRERKMAVSKYAQPSQYQNQRSRSLQSKQVSRKRNYESLSTARHFQQILLLLQLRPYQHRVEPEYESSSTSSSRRQSAQSTTSSSKPQTTGRAQATREDKNEFLSALGMCALGRMTMPMLYFYKYLLKHGEEDGMPQIDKDLFFYIEVQKFKDGSHNFSDEEMLKRKVQSIVDCFLDSVYSPTLQIDIPSDMQQRTLKTAQRYLSGKEMMPTLFDDAQFHVFKELLFYWAGYKRAVSTPEDPRKRPVTKYDKMMRRRMENIHNYQVPSSDFNLPAIPEGAVPSFTISLSEGVKFKDMDESFAGTPQPDHHHKDHRGSKATIVGADGHSKRSRGQSRRESLTTR